MNVDNIKLEKAVRLMNQKGLDGLVIYSAGTGDISFPRYLQYFAEYKQMSNKNAAIISKDGAVVLLIEPKWDALRVARKTWIQDVCKSPNFCSDLKSILRKFEIKGTVGLIGRKVMRRDIYECIAAEVDIRAADDIIEEIAKEKTAGELDIIRKAARAADVGFEAFRSHARTGIREYELFAEMEYAMRCAGSEDGFNLLSSGKHNYAMHAATDRRLCDGDIIIAEITSVCEGNYSHLCRTVVLGKPSSFLTDIYGMLAHALDKALKVVKPGKPASIISREINRVISEAGYAKYCRPPYMRIRGHGFGVGSVAPGTVIDDNTQAPIEKHQVLAIHPNQYIPETGYLACGETVLVTETGLERLTNTESKIYIK